MAITVYVLKLSNNSYYTGITKDLNNRLQQHNKGQSKSTRHGRPITLIYSVELPDYKQARWLEVKIKNRGASRYLRQLRSNNLVQLVRR